MAQSIITHALCDKHAELAGLVSDLERKLRDARADLEHVDAVIRLFDPTIRPATIKAKGAAPAKSPHFESGEIARRCRDALRMCGPDGVTAADVAATALSDKGISDDAKGAADFTKRMYWTLNRLGQDGVARKIGSGQSARWVLEG